MIANSAVRKVSLGRDHSSRLPALFIIWPSFQALDLFKPLHSSMDEEWTKGFESSCCSSRNPIVRVMAGELIVDYKLRLVRKVSLDDDSIRVERCAVSLERQRSLSYDSLFEPLRL